MKGWPVKMDKFYDTLLNSLAIIAKVSSGYVTITNKDGIRIKTVDSHGKEVLELKGVHYKLAKKASDKQKGVHGMSQLEHGAESWCIPVGDYVVCASNVERVKSNNELKKSLINALPFVARVAGGEAVVYDKDGVRIASVNSSGKANKEFIGKVSEDALKSIKEQKPVIGKSNYINGASAVRIPISKEFGFGFNNDSFVLENQALVEEMKKYQNVRYNFSDIIGDSRQINKAKEIAKLASNSQSNVLIFGETGTGKEVFAQSIHNDSKRFDKPFVAINCAAIPHDLMESSFFGYEGGAFTGAKKGGSPGVFEQANGGTLFLDEISEMHLDLQSKILRVLQEREVRRIGGKENILLDVRVISATNKNLEDMVKKKDFREDLYYRLNVLDINLPSLRHIKEDIPFFIENAINKMNIVFGKFIEGVDENSLKTLLAYDWPGNVRELMNCIEKAFNVIGKETIIRTEHLPRKIKEKFNIKDINGDGLESILNEYEKQVIKNALKIHNWNRVNTAEYLRISTTTLWRKMRQYNID